MDIRRNVGAYKTMFTSETGLVLNALGGLKRGFQLQKIYIENLKDSHRVAALESDLSQYFSCFGNVIDTKILRHGRLIRQPSTIRICNLLT